FEQNTAQP
uniref:Tumor-associated antigen MUT1 n=1 Tax=Mus musculus TaxID=10090 RepID=Q7M067_MOUSE